MKKWFKKIGQSFLRKDEAKTKEATPAVEQEEIKAKEAPPAVEQEIKTKEATPAVEQEIKTKEAPPAVEQEIKAKEATPAVEQEEIKAKEATPLVTQLEAPKIQKNKKSWFNKLGDNFKKTSSNIRKAIFVKRLDEKSLEEIEEAFLMSDLGVNNTNLLIDELKNKKINTNNNTQENVAEFLEKQFSNINHELNLKPNKKLRVILVFGVNGSGKTTTIAKLAKKGKDKKLKVLLAAADTFRAAAKEQIEKWANIIQIEVLSGNIGEDPSSVVFKAHKKAIDEKFDLLIIDTAGRLHNKIELMEELKKMTRIIQKNDEEAPHNKILVLDSTIGQNTYNQIDSFHQNIGLTGVIMTKLDGSAKGGSLIGITRKYNLPIHALGVGEKIDDLIPFIPKDFINALLGDNKGEKK